MQYDTTDIYGAPWQSQNNAVWFKLQEDNSIKAKCGWELDTIDTVTAPINQLIINYSEMARRYVRQLVKR